MTAAPDHVMAVLDELRAYLDDDATVNIGFLSTLDVDLMALRPFLNWPLNNVGGPFADSAYPRNEHCYDSNVSFAVAGDGTEGSG